MAIKKSIQSTSPLAKKNGNTLLAALQQGARGQDGLAALRARGGLFATADDPEAIAYAARENTRLTSFNKIENPRGDAEEDIAASSEPGSPTGPGKGAEGKEDVLKLTSSGSRQDNIPHGLSPDANGQIIGGNSRVTEQTNKLTEAQRATLGFEAKDVDYTAMYRDGKFDKDLTSDEMFSDLTMQITEPLTRADNGQTENLAQMSLATNSVIAQDYKERLEQLAEAKTPEAQAKLIEGWQKEFGGDDTTKHLQKITDATNAKLKEMGVDSSKFTEEQQAQFKKSLLTSYSGALFRNENYADMLGLKDKAEVKDNGDGTFTKSLELKGGEEGAKLSLTSDGEDKVLQGEIDITIPTGKQGEDGKDEYIPIDGEGKGKKGTEMPSPIIFDLKGDGISLSSKEDGVKFDIDGKGSDAVDGDSLDQTAWTKGGTEFDDAFLTLDRDGDGTVDSGNELFGDQRDDVANGYEELAKFDSDGDNKITDADVFTAENAIRADLVGQKVMDNLKLWSDMNHDGKSDESEMRTLREAGITSINTEAQGAKGQVFDQHGNDIGVVSDATREDGSKVGTTDAFFQADINKDHENKQDNTSS